MADRVDIAVKLRCFLHRDGDVWVAGCPHLDVYSQGDNPKEAQAALHEAITLWIESCLERNTFEQAMSELGWQRVPAGSENDSPSGIEITECAEFDEFEVETSVPAFQAASLLQSATG